MFKHLLKKDQTGDAWLSSICVLIFWLSPLTNVTLELFLQFNDFYYLVKIKKRKSLLLI